MLFQNNILRGCCWTCLHTDRLPFGFSESMHICAAPCADLMSSVYQLIRTIISRLSTASLSGVKMVNQNKVFNSISTLWRYFAHLDWCETWFLLVSATFSAIAPFGICLQHAGLELPTVMLTTCRLSVSLVTTKAVNVLTGLSDCYRSRRHREMWLIAGLLARAQIPPSTPLSPAWVSNHRADVWRLPWSHWRPAAGWAIADALHGFNQSPPHKP